MQVQTHKIEKKLNVQDEGTKPEEMQVQVYE